MKRFLQSIGVLLAIGLGFVLTAQSPSLPGIQGFYPAGLKYVPVQVDKNGVMQVSSGGGGSFCPNPCPVVGTANSGSVPSGAPVQTAGSDGTDIRTIRTDTTGHPITLLTGSGTVVSGQQAVTGTAAALGSQASNSVCVQALKENTINIYIGPSGVTTSTGLELVPGANYCGPLNNVNLIFVVASTTGASVSWLATD